MTTRGSRNAYEVEIHAPEKLVRRYLKKKKESLDVEQNYADGFLSQA